MWKNKQVVCLESDIEKQANQSNYKYMSNMGIHFLLSQIKLFFNICVENLYFRRIW